MTSDGAAGTRQGGPSVRLLYTKQGKIAEGGAMYVRGMRGYEKVWGVGHASTLATTFSMSTRV